MAPPTPDVLGVTTFLRRVQATSTEHLAARDVHPTWQQRFAFLQASFGIRGIHYEVWLQQARRQVEVGLHFEADSELNGWLLRRFAPEMPAIRHALGAGFELEQWTASWGRVHAYLPLAQVDDVLVGQVSQCLADTVVCLQPLLTTFLAESRRP
jgi:hypothetical protein